MKELRLLGPSGVVGTNTEAAYIARQAKLVGGAHIIVERANTVTAYVNEGRWLADCPYCNAGISIRPDWAARCFGCGAVYRNVTWPLAGERDRIESALALRQRRVSKNWLPSESPDVLVAENVAHGLVQAPTVPDSDLSEKER